MRIIQSAYADISAYMWISASSATAWPTLITLPLVAKLYLTIQLRPQFSENGRFTLKRLGQNIKKYKLAN